MPDFDSMTPGEIRAWRRRRVRSLGAENYAALRAACRLEPYLLTALIMTPQERMLDGAMAISHATGLNSKKN